MRYLRWLILITLIALAIWRIYPHLAELSDFIKITKKVNLVFLFLAILTQIGQYIGDGWLSQLALKIVGIRINLRKTLEIASIDVFAAHIFPVGEAGVIATTYYFYKKLGVDNQSLIFLTIFWSLSTGIALVILLLISLFFMPKIPNVSFRPSQPTLYLIILLSLLALFLVLSRKTLWPKIEKFLSRFAPAREILKFTRNLQEHKDTIIRHKRLSFEAIVAGFIYYLSNIATLAFCFLAFGQLPSLALISIAYFISLIAGWIALSPGGLGATEATLILIFHEFNIEPSLSLAVILAFRVINFWLPIPAGAISYFSLGREFKKKQA